MVVATENEGFQILLEALRFLRVLYVQAQMIGIVVVAAKNSGWQRTKRLMNDRFHSVSRYDCPLRRPLDIFGGNNFNRHYNQPAPRLSLLLVLPARSVDLTISLAVRNLHMTNRTCSTSTRLW